MAFRVEFSAQSNRDLERLRLFDQTRIVSAIREQLVHQPETQTRNRKCLGDQVTAEFEYVPPLWELRVGQFRVFYEIDAAENVVYIHAVRLKPPHRTTGDVVRGAP